MGRRLSAREAACNPVSSSSTAQRDELSYSDFNSEIRAGNIKDATITGSTNITGNYNHCRERNYAI